MSTRLLVPKIAPNFIRGVWGQKCTGSLGMIFAPGRFKPHQPQIIRNLQQDLKILKNEYGIQTITSLIQQHECAHMRISQLKQMCRKMSIKSLCYEIPDFGIPSDSESFKHLVKKVVDQEIKQNKAVLVHCKAGLGRTGMFASACLIYHGLNPDEAIAIVRRARPGTIQTNNQVQFVKSLKF